MADEPVQRETPTTNYGFTKPDVNGSDDVWGGEWNANLDSIDANLYRIDIRPAVAVVCR